MEAQKALDEAKTFQDAGNYSMARERAEHALALREAVLGANHPDVATCLNVAGDLARRQGDLKGAESLLQRAFDIRKAALDANHPLVAQVLNNLANLYTDQGLYEKAEPLFQRALAIRKLALGEDHPDVAVATNNLARLYLEQGLYNRAREHFTHALSIWEKTLGENHPNVALVLNNLALVDKAQGLYKESEEHQLRALHIDEKLLGEDHPDVATVLNNLATLYQEQGLYDRAEVLLQRSRRIYTKALGADHPDVAMVVSNLGVLSELKGAYAEAKDYYQLSLFMYEKAFGERNPSVADMLKNLADLSMKQKEYEQARLLYLQTLDIQEEVLGKNHPTLAATLGNLASLDREQGLYDQAESHFQRALLLNQDQFVHTQLLNSLALLRLKQQRLGDALPLFADAFALSEQRLRREALDFSELRLATFLQYLRDDEQTLYVLLREHPEDPQVRRLALSAVLLLKGRSLEEMAHISQAIHHDLPASDRDTLERLQVVSTQLADLPTDNPDLPQAEYASLFQSLLNKRDDLETQLAKKSASLRALTALPGPQDIVERVAASLPKDSALIEYIAYNDGPLVPDKGSTPAQRAKPSRYLALVLFPDASTRTVDLGLAEPLDAAAKSLHAVLANSHRLPFQTTAHQLYQLAFQPLLSVLDNTRHLFLAPDGQLSLVPFDVLHDGKGFLLDAFDISYVTSGRELLPRPQNISPSSSISVIANPTFTRQQRLHGTLREAQMIQRLLPQAKLYLGSEATKKNLLQLSTPGILHLATHGIILGEDPSPPLEEHTKKEPSHARVRTPVTFTPPEDPPPPPLPQNPLLRSKLVLAKDAQVTALELAGLDLWGTQLVVLSACDTGRGEVHPGQGIYGLRSSLMAAGTETLVTSLWLTDDDSTPLLMESYYSSLLAGHGRADALRRAMRALRASHPHPHDWAPFISLGSEAPLRAIIPATPQPPLARASFGQAADLGDFSLQGLADTASALPRFVTAPW